MTPIPTRIRKMTTTSQLYLIFPARRRSLCHHPGEEEVHSFAWSADSQTIFFATRQPWTKSQKDDYKKRLERRRAIPRRRARRCPSLRLDLIRRSCSPRRRSGVVTDKEKDKEKDETRSHARRARRSLPARLRVDHLVTSPDGRKLAFLTNSDQPAPGKI